MLLILLLGEQYSSTMIWTWVNDATAVIFSIKYFNSLNSMLCQETS